MNINDALNALGLLESATLADVKTAYRKSASIYHPDRNPSGEDMMKLINSAYEALQDFFNKNPNSESVEFFGDDNNYDYGKALNEALNLVRTFQGVTVELCGTWLWVGGDTKQYKDAFKQNGFKWAKKKAMWYFRPESKKSRKRSSKFYSMDEIRSNYGSTSFSNKERKEINY